MKDRLLAAAVLTLLTYLGHILADLIDWIVRMLINDN